MVSCELVTGLTLNLLVSVYVPPSMLEYLPNLEKALKRFKEPIFLGNLNVDLDKAMNPWSQRVADLLAENGLIYLVHQFCQRRSLQNLISWSQVQQGTVLWSRCDYILRTDQHRFKMVGIRDMRNFSLNHFSLRARLLQRPNRCHARYLRGRRAFTLRLPPTN